MAKAGPLRFSTKYQDEESDLIYYGYRYHNASTGRWISRDPIQEKGGLNVYGFVRNNPIQEVDKDGREESQWTSFSVCSRKVQGYCPANDCGQWHAYMQYAPPSPEVGPPYVGGWGSHGPGGTGPDGGADPKDCGRKFNRKTWDTLQNGSGKGKKSSDATEAEIWDCIKNTPPKKYDPILYNCLDYVLDAASQCGLEEGGTYPGF
jgi:RHS repeat-associated protein